MGRWPALKTLLLERGDISFGQVVDSDVAEIYKMSRPALTVLAGHLYSSDRPKMTRHNPVHVLWKSHPADDTEPYVYTSYHDESIGEISNYGQPCGKNRRFTVEDLKNIPYRRVYP
uniref:Uncharacterized protein n=1 Tax=Salmonella sp. TaxID=599 RepID=A0A482EVQ1_SALSP|nr:hypothetical protein NNIBIDOC_00196 [Salmonella sp.]